MRKAIVALLAAGVMLISSVAQAADTVTVTMEGKSGKIGAEKMPVIEYTLEASRPDGKREVKMPPLTFTKKIDKSSEAIAKAAASGEPISTVVLEVHRPGAQGKGETVMTITLKVCLIAKVANNGAGAGGAEPTETVAVNYKEIETK